MAYDLCLTLQCLLSYENVMKSFDKYKSKINYLLISSSCLILVLVIGIDKFINFTLDVVKTYIHHCWFVMSCCYQVQGTTYIFVCLQHSFHSSLTILDCVFSCHYWNSLQIQIIPLIGTFGKSLTNDVHYHRMFQRNMPQDHCFCPFISSELLSTYQRLLPWHHFLNVNENNWDICNCCICIFF